MTGRSGLASKCRWGLSDLAKTFSGFDERRGAGRAYFGEVRPLLEDALLIGIDNLIQAAWRDGFLQ